MTPAGAKRLTLLALIVAGGLASIDSLEHAQLPPVRIALGAAIAGLVLFGLADPAPELAGGLAGLLLVGSLLSHGHTIHRIGGIL